MEKNIIINKEISISSKQSRDNRKDLKSGKKFHRLFSFQTKAINGLISALVFFSFFVMIACSSQKDQSYVSKSNWPDIYKQTGSIRISDPMASLVGSLPHGKEVIEISLIDVAKYTGHVCPGVYSGFIMTRQALQKLFPNSVPQRGTIKLKANYGHDLLDVAAYITGARTTFGRGEINQGDILLDKSLGTDRSKKIIVFMRKDNGRQIKATFDSNAIMDPSKRASMKQKMMKVLTGKASDKLKKQVAQTVQEKIKALMQIKNTAKFIRIQTL